ncbi:Monocarboxylate transporter 2 like protein [Argiope bruennichi]|uniref:Monocarboxylate transporter 2 like protein n=1 Tax=Argiope bruennichi TaxID=94029 RepID=A0A8T0EF46_ARGBR|nr:Monocarboxylate transporter 2 like protein [Argiope bruennichi]
MKSTGLNSRDSWLATMACTFISFLCMMPVKLSGLLFVEILERYNTDRAMASYPLFLCMVVRCSGGPITGYCGERFGLNAVILTGCVLSALGVGACFLAEDIITVIIFLGLVYGLGMNLNTTLFPQVVKQHFNKNVTFAISMTMFGGCFGGFIIPPLIKWIFQSYGVSGTFLIMGGIMLNGVPATMLLKILKPKKKSVQISQKEVKPLVAGPEELVDAIKIKNIDDEKQKNIEGKKELCIWELRDISNNKIPSSLSSELIDDEKLLNNGTTIHFKPHLIEDKLLKNNKDTLEQTATLLPKCIESVHENTENNVPSEAKVANKKPVSKQKAALQSLTIFLDFAFLTMLVAMSAEVIIQVWTLTTVLDYARDKSIDRIYEVYFLMALPLAELFGRFHYIGCGRVDHGMGKDLCCHDGGNISIWTGHQWTSVSVPNAYFRVYRAEELHNGYGFKVISLWSDELLVFSSNRLL